MSLLQILKNDNDDNDNDDNSNFKKLKNNKKKRLKISQNQSIQKNANSLIRTRTDDNSQFIADYNAICLDVPAAFVPLLRAQLDHVNEIDVNNAVEAAASGEGGASSSSAAVVASTIDAEVAMDVSKSGMIFSGRECNI